MVENDLLLYLCTRKLKQHMILGKNRLSSNHPVCIRNFVLPKPKYWLSFVSGHLYWIILYSALLSSGRLLHSCVSPPKPKPPPPPLFILSLSLSLVHSISRVGTSALSSSPDPEKQLMCTSLVSIFLSKLADIYSVGYCDRLSSAVYAVQLSCVKIKFVALLLGSVRSTW